MTATTTRTSCRHRRVPSTTRPDRGVPYSLNCRKKDTGSVRNPGVRCSWIGRKYSSNHVPEERERVHILVGVRMRYWVVCPAGAKAKSIKGLTAGMNACSILLIRIRCNQPKIIHPGPASYCQVIGV